VATDQNDELLRQILGTLGQILDRLPERAPKPDPNGPQPIKEPDVPKAARRPAAKQVRGSR
jgi:hypothetical protein